jgi:hypothetical protein
MIFGMPTAWTWTAHLHLFAAKVFSFMSKVCIFVSGKFLGIGARWTRRAGWCQQQGDFHVAETEKEIKRLESER